LKKRERQVVRAKCISCYLLVVLWRFMVCFRTLTVSQTTWLWWYREFIL
jgi:hypothetical protein